ncbi:unnamed protein product [Phyllotreta striolata]|uniref:Farnesol dehydrogenase-like n=1 Tax=Phyllotreta striolata TaxID=444603 RepID=A0A9N9TJ84_PHYSR|nr:unnamed protein product [Phyllotreta striolata]
MDRWVGSVAIVTGASAGIGRSIAEKLVEAGVKVVGIARRKEKLDDLQKSLASKKGKFFPYVGDVSKEDDIKGAFKWTKENVGPVSILINNAGIVRLSQASTFETKDWVDTLNVNVLAVGIATREAIQEMKKNNIDGHIININSIAGLKIGSFEQMTIYQGSKYALTAITETLRLELAKSGSKIRMTGIHPGGVVTEIFEQLSEKFDKAALDKMKTMSFLNAEDVAETVLYALSTPKHVLITQLTVQAVGEIY